MVAVDLQSLGEIGPLKVDMCGCLNCRKQGKQHSMLKNARTGASSSCKQPSIPGLFKKTPV